MKKIYVSYVFKNPENFTQNISNSSDTYRFFITKNPLIYIKKPKNNTNNSYKTNKKVLILIDFNRDKKKKIKKIN